MRSLHDVAEKTHGFPHQNPPLLLPSSHTSNPLALAKIQAASIAPKTASPACRPQTVSASPIFAPRMCCMSEWNSLGKSCRRIVWFVMNLASINMIADCLDGRWVVIESLCWDYGTWFGRTRRDG